jgi:hypothetical protein
LRNYTKYFIARRVFFSSVISLALTSACGAKSIRIRLNIPLFSYLDRPVYDVMMNKTNFMSALDHAFYGSNAVMLTQSIDLGAQVVSWKLDGPEGMPRNGDLVMAKNRPILQSIGKDIKWLALHIYSYDTVEIKLGKGTAEELQAHRGKRISEAWELKNK